MIGQDKPDCYVIVSVGAEEYRFAKIKRSSNTFSHKKSFYCYRTPVRRDTCDPDWSGKEEW